MALHKFSSAIQAFICKVPWQVCCLCLRGNLLFEEAFDADTDPGHDSYCSAEQLLFQQGMLLLQLITVLELMVSASTPYVDGFQI